MPHPHPELPARPPAMTPLRPVRMTAPRSARLWLGLFVAAGAVNLAGELAGSRIAFGLGLVSLMPLLAGFLLSLTRSRAVRSRLVRLVLAALVFSWFGDAVGAAFVPKVAFFGIAQVCYVVAFWPYRRSSVWSRPPVALAYLGGLAVLVVVVAAHAGALGLPVVLYGGTLALMATLSTGVSRVVGCGGALFAVSDSILALDRFVPWVALPHASSWNMLTYISAQALLAWGSARRTSPVAEPAT